MDRTFILNIVFIFLLSSLMFYYLFEGMFEFATGKLGKAIGHAFVAGLNLTLIFMDLLELI